MDTRHPHPTHDVIVMGGGLAGLTLALQLRDRFPDLDVLVLERRRHPVPAACHKVGESTVEIGAHYFAEVLGLREHLETAQIRKFGFRFFFSEGRRDLGNVTELGASAPLPAISWQIDRGLFENFLGQEVQRRGARFVDGALIRDLALAPAGDGDALHTVSWQVEDGVVQTAQARWVIDACGRAGIIKRQRDLALPNAHAAHAVWFRIADRLDVDAWSADPAWRARCVTPTRWRSTNHMVGAGYWVWLIPLASGSHSVGIVADPAYHPLETMNTFERAMDWLERYQPVVFDALDPRRDKLQDFAFFKRFSYDCKQVFSAERWALAGEAGRFLDPFYSPGSDFIGIGNTYITELIARDRAGLPLAAHVKIYEQIFRSFYDSTLALYTNQYGIFGSPTVLPVKVLWDYAYYWSVLAPLFHQQRLTDLALLAKLRDELALAQQLNLDVQALLRAWSAADDHAVNPKAMLDQASWPWFAELNRALLDPPADGEVVRRRLADGVALLRQLAGEIAERATRAEPQAAGVAAATAAPALREALAALSTPPARARGRLLFDAPLALAA